MFLLREWEVARTVVAPPSSVVKCLWEVFVWGFGVFFLTCVCVSVSGVLFSVGVCVCDLLIFSQGVADMTRSLLSQLRARGVRQHTGGRANPRGGLGLTRVVNPGFRVNLNPGRGVCSPPKRVNPNVNTLPSCLSQGVADMTRSLLSQLRARGVRQPHVVVASFVLHYLSASERAQYFREICEAATRPFILLVIKGAPYYISRYI